MIKIEMKIFTKYLVGKLHPDLQENLEKLLVHVGCPTPVGLTGVLSGVDPTPQTLDPRFIQPPLGLVHDLLLATLGLITNCIWGA